MEMPMLNYQPKQFNFGAQNFMENMANIGQAAGPSANDEQPQQ